VSVMSPTQTAVHGSAKPDADTPRQRREDEAHEVAAAAFEALLDSTRTLVRSEALFAKRVSPDQMFDPPAAEGQGRGPAPAKDRDQSMRADELRNVEDSRGGVAGRGSDEVKARMGASTVDSLNRKSIGDRTETRASNVPARTSLPESDGPMASLPLNDRGIHRGTNSGANVGASNGNNEASPAPELSRNPIVTGTQAIDTKAVSAPNVARQVGELLGASRGASESGQLAMSTSAVGDARSSGTSKTTAPSAERTPQSQVGNGPTETVEAKEATPFQRLIRSMQLQAGTRSSSARLQLHPPELGHIRVDVNLAGETVDIEVRTETEEARDLVSRRADQLRAALEQHGIHVDRFEVTTNTASGRHFSATPYHDAAVSADGRSNGSGNTGGRRGEDERIDDSGAASPRVESLTAVAEARLDIRV